MLKPMLSPNESPLSYPNYFKEIKYPLYGSIKLDGIRATVQNGVVLSRTLKPIRSVQVQAMYGKLEGFDGELTAGATNDPLVFNKTTSAVMSYANFVDDLHFSVFDRIGSEVESYDDRYRELCEEVSTMGYDNVSVVNQVFIKNETELLQYEAETLAIGYEGIMLRSIDGRYKYNRCTWLDGIIFKLKRFEDAEGTVVDIEEGDVNLNEQRYDERGYSTRSINKENLVPSGMVGRFIVDFDGQLLEVPPGSFNHKEREDILRNKERYIGLPLKFRFQRSGMKDLPRFIRAIGFRTD
jgi:DNA ligase-1